MIRDLAFQLTCPDCGQLAGFVCRDLRSPSLTARRRHPHVSRLRAARAVVVASPGDVALKRTYLNDPEFHPVTCVQCGHVGGLKVTLSDLLIEMMEREERNGFDRGWSGAVSFFMDGGQGLPPTVEPEEMRRRAKLTRDAAEEDARKLESAALDEDMKRMAACAGPGTGTGSEKP